MKNYLRILTISQVSHRNLAFKKLDLSKHESGHIRLLGGVGDGKTNLLELFRLATEERCELRNKNINPDGKYKAGFEVRFSDNLYISVSKTASGDITTTLYAKDVNGKKITPMIADQKLTVSDYKKMLVTELTYGADKFLSDNPTIQWEFLKSVYADQLAEKGLIGDGENPETLTFQLKQAVLKRDIAQVEQSRLGAYKKHLEEEYQMVCPDYADISVYEKGIADNNLKIQELTQQIADHNLKAQQVYSKAKESTIAKYNEAKKAIQDRINVIANKISLHNETAQAKYEKDVTALKSKLEAENKIMESRADKFYAIIKAFEDLQRELPDPEKLGRDKELALTEPLEILHAQCERSKEWFNSTGLGLLPEMNDVIAEIANIPEPVTIPDLESYSDEQICQFNAILGDNMFSELFELYDREYGLETNHTFAMEIPEPKYLTLKWEEIKLIPSENRHALHTEIYKLMVENINLTSKITDSTLLNNIYARFVAYREYCEADEAVTEVRTRIKRAYLDVDTGVPGMKLQWDDAKDKIFITYDGRCFYESVQTTDSLLTDYSHTQRRMIAIHLQLYLLSKKERPLNVMWLDELGLDKKTCELIESFAKEHGLLIITASTGDYLPENLNENEILIENGHLIFSDKVEDFSPEELAKIRKETPAEEPIADVIHEKKTKKKAVGKLHQKTIMEGIEEAEAQKDAEQHTGKIVNPADEI